VNILSITAGAAEMYCGSCLRDNALAAALGKRGHEVTLLPIYTPTVTDEVNVSAPGRVFLGGISVYLQQHFAVFRYTPWLLDRLWDSPAVIKRFAARSINVNPKLLGAMTVSTLKGESGFQRKEIAKLLAWLKDEPCPDVVNLPNSLLISLAAPIRRVLDRPVVVTMQGEDLFLEGLPPPYRQQAIDLIRQQVDQVDCFVAISEYYATFMADYLRIPARKIRTVPLGVNVNDLRPGAEKTPRPFTIGYLARVAPEKGLHNLADAYRVLRRERGLPPARLVAAGYLAPGDRKYLADIETKLTEWGLRDEFRYAGTVDRLTKITFLQDLDVLSVPSGYHEPKALYLLEAMACGVPVVEPNHGAFPELLARTGGGILAASERPADIADGLEALWRDPDRARALGQQAVRAVRAHYSIEGMADAMLAVYRESVDDRARNHPSHENVSVASR
jgi:glycosyltransferase involved in cell wall biosynthesis